MTTRITISGRGDEHRRSMLAKLREEAQAQSVDSDDDDDEDEEEDDDSSQSTRLTDEQYREIKQQQRMMWEQRQMARQQKRMMASMPPSGVPMNPYAPPQPRYVDNDVLSQRMSKLEGMVQMTLVGVWLTAIVFMVTAMLLTMHFGVTK